MTIFDNIKNSWFNNPEVELKPASDLAYRSKQNKSIVVCMSKV